MVLWIVRHSSPMSLMHYLVARRINKPAPSGPKATSNNGILKSETKFDTIVTSMSWRRFGVLGQLALVCGPCSLLPLCNWLRQPRSALRTGDGGKRRNITNSAIAKISHLQTSLFYQSIPKHRSSPSTFASHTLSSLLPQTESHSTVIMSVASALKGDTAQQARSLVSLYSSSLLRGIIQYYIRKLQHAHFFLLTRINDE